MRRRWNWKHHGSKYAQMKPRGRSKKRPHPRIETQSAALPPPKHGTFPVKPHAPKRVGWLRRLFQRRVV